MMVADRDDTTRLISGKTVIVMVMIIALVGDNGN